VEFDLPPQEIDRHHNSRSLRQGSGSSSHARDDHRKKSQSPERGFDYPAAEKRFFETKNAKGIVRKPSSPPPQHRILPVPARNSSLPEEMRPRTRGKDAPRTPDRRLSEGTYDRPRRGHIEDVPKEPAPYDDGDDAARRARYERRRLREAKEAKDQEKRFGGLRGVFKRLFS